MEEEMKKEKDGHEEGFIFRTMDNWANGFCEMGVLDLTINDVPKKNKKGKRVA